MSAVSGSRKGRTGYIRMASLVAVAAAGLLAGCFVDSGSSGSGGGPVPGAGGSAGSSAGSSSAGQPVLVDVDTNRTLEATPGQGIGVYVEYDQGGHWTVSWTCDTGLTNLSCSFAVNVTVAAGTIANLASTGFGSGDSVDQPNSQALAATTTTTTGTDAVLFDTTPGAIITVTVNLNGPVSFFFVQDGQVNGGYKGPLTNPLMFKPLTP